MALIHDRGRVFGRINLIDFALLAFVVVLLPLGYGSYLLFRTPPPQIHAVTPNPVTFKRGEQRVRVTGEYLRPFMKATLGQYDARAFLVEHATSAELLFVDLPIGTYDLALFDAAREVARMPHALTVVPPPAPPVQIVGAFVGANAADAALTAGARFGDEKSGVEIITAGSLQNGERQATRSNELSGNASGRVRSPNSNLAPGAFCRASSNAGSQKSTPTTAAPRRASAAAKLPEPVPASSARSPSPGARSSSCRASIA